MKAKALVSAGVLAVFAIACSAGDPPPVPAATPTASAITGIQAPAGTMATPAPMNANAAPAANAPGGAPAIAAADGETSGLRLEVTEFKRASGGTVNLKFAMINASDKPHSFSYDYGDGSYGATDYNAIGGVHLIDPVGKKKYFVARDSDNKCVCSKDLAAIPPGGRVNVWAKFPAPPDDVDKISIVVPHFSPMDDVTLAR